MKRARDIFAPGLNGSGGLQNETRVPVQQQHQLKHLCETHPAVVAAKQVIHTQLLSGGLVLKRNGEVVEIQPAFRRHLDTHWSSFAKDMLDSLITYGFAVVSYEMEDDGEESATTPLRLRDYDASVTGVPKAAKPKSEQLIRRRNASNVVPTIADVGTYEIAFSRGGRAGMQRKYRIYRKQPNGIEIVDDGSVLFVRNHPDASGKINSPIATVSYICAFVDKILDITVQAEEQRSRPPIVTQTRPQPSKSGPTTQDIYFDSEGRDMLRETQQDENESAAMALRMQIELCRAINSLRGQAPGGFSSSGPSSSATMDFGERMFSLPTNQETASTPTAQSRGDVTQLVQMSNEHICTALGVPASLLFENRFASQTTAQLTLLNSTINQLSVFVNAILTSAYVDVHGTEGVDAKSSDTLTTNDVELVVSTSPMVASQEMLSLFAGGIADFDAAAPLALRAVGLSTSEIENAMRRHSEHEEEDKKMKSEDREYEKERRSIEIDQAVNQSGVAPNRSKSATESSDKE